MSKTRFMGVGMKEIDRLTEEETQQYNLLNMMYQKVRVTDRGFFICEDDKYVYLLNKVGAEICKYDKNNGIIAITESFICCVNSTNIRYGDIVEIISLNTCERRNVTFQTAMFVPDTDSIMQEIDGFLFLKNHYGALIFDDELNVIGCIGHLTGGRLFKNYSTYQSLFVAYTIDFNQSYIKIKIDKATKKVEYYGIIEKGKDCNIAAVELCYKSGQVYDLNKLNSNPTVDFNMDEYYMYKLYLNEKVVGDKSYIDIQKLKESEDNVYLVYERYCDKYRKVGLMNSEGKEIIPTENKEITYIGSHNYIVRRFINLIKTETYIYNIMNGQKSQIYNDFNVVQHPTLPLTIIKKNDGSTIILDVKGNLFDIKDFSKYFKCSYCQTQPTMLKIDFEYGSKYVDNRLTPITNMHALKALSQQKWVDM